MPAAAAAAAASRQDDAVARVNKNIREQVMTVGLTIGISFANPSNLGMPAMVLFIFGIELFVVLIVAEKALNLFARTRGAAFKETRMLFMNNLVIAKQIVISMITSSALALISIIFQGTGEDTISVEAVVIILVAINLIIALSYRVAALASERGGA